MVASLPGEGVVGKLFQKLPRGGDDVIVTGGHRVAVDQRDDGLSGRFGWVALRARKLRGVADQPEDLLVLRVEVDQLQHQLRGLPGGLRGLLEARLEVGRRRPGRQGARAARDDESEGEEWRQRVHDEAFLRASTIFLASGAISLSGKSLMSWSNLPAGLGFAVRACRGSVRS